MSNVEQLKKELDNNRNLLLKSCMQAKDRESMGRANVEKAKNIDKELDSLAKIREAIKEAINYITKEYKNIEKYAVDRKELSLQLLHLAIKRAGSIVPDADTEGIELKLTDKAAKIVNGLGQDINLREGSAFRTVMGILIRYTLMKAQPDAIQTVLLDEHFSTLSDETTNAMREYFEVFKEDIAIVGIEQHDTLFQGMDKTVYTVMKNGKVSEVFRET